MTQHLAPQLAGDIERAQQLLSKAGVSLGTAVQVDDLRHHAARDLRRIDASIPPFRLPHRLQAAPLAHQMDSLFRRFDGANAPSLPALALVATEQLRLPRTDPVRKAIMAAALMAEDMPDNAYHNATHVREVLCNAVMLNGVNARKARINARYAAPLSVKEQARLLLAALAHDLGHDGGSNMVPDGPGRQKRVPYRLENIAVKMIKPVMAQAGMTRSDMEEVEVMILATDPGGPHAAVMKALDHHFAGQPLPAKFPGRLKALKSSRRLAVMCGLMCDADILGSAGLTVGINRIQGDRLSREWGRPLRSEDTIGFLKHVVGMRFCTAAGHVFDSNLQRIHDDAVANSKAPKPDAPADRPDEPA